MRRTEVEVWRSSPHFLLLTKTMVEQAAPSYMGNVYEGFARQADVLLIVEGQELPAHNFDDAQQSYSRLLPLRLEAPLQRYKTATIESFLQHVYRQSPYIMASEAEAWAMFSLADHLDCPKLMQSCVAAIEASKGQDLLSATHGTNGALYWLLLSEKYRLAQFQSRCIAFVAEYFTWLKDDPQLLQLRPQTFKLLCDALLVTDSKTGSWKRHGPTRHGGTQMNYCYSWTIEYTCCNSCPGHRSEYKTPGDHSWPEVVELKLGGKLVCQGLRKRFPTVTVNAQPSSFQEMVSLMTPAS